MSESLFPPTGRKLPWRHSQSDFVAHVRSYAFRGGFRNGTRRLTVDEVGELLLKIYDVDLAPYPDFHAMRVAVPPLVKVKTTARLMLTVLFYIYYMCRMRMAKFFPLSEIDRQEQMACETVARDFLERLSPYVEVKRDADGNII